ncbi:hypothetical protein Holit_02465 [Hollandina sp. SP2]
MEKIERIRKYYGTEVHVSPSPPGTSKWNEIEHRMFCFISKNWKGRALISVERVKNCLYRDKNKYELGTKITDEELAKLNITRDIFHGDWNYIVLPKI